MTASLALPGEEETDFDVNPPMWELLGEYRLSWVCVGY